MMPPALWTLSGHATILIGTFSPTFLAHSAAIPAGMDFCGGVGFVLLAHYTQSPVGAYNELAFIGGRYQYGNRRGLSCTHIVVDSEASMMAGRKNWSLPKQLATFELDGDRTRVSDGDQLLAEINIRQQGWLPRLPVHSGLLPKALRRVIQWEDGHAVAFTPYGTGWVTPGKRGNITVNGALFPDFSEGRLWGVLVFPHFTLKIPAAHPLDKKGN